MTWNWSARVTGLAVLTTVGALSTCKEDSAGPSSGKTPIELARGTIGTAGGQLKGSDGRFVLQVPPGALPSATEIVVNQLADPSSFSAGISKMAFPATLAGPVISIQSGIDTLAVPARLTVPYDPHLVPQGASASGPLVVRRRASGPFEVLSGGLDVESPVLEIDTVAGTISLQVSHFSDVAPVLIPPSRPTRFDTVGCRESRPALTAGIYDDQDVIYDGLDSNGHPLYGLQDRRADVSAIVIHSTSSGPNPKHTILIDMALGVNGENGKAYQAHYYIDRNGDVYRLVADISRARHVGQVLPVPPQYNDYTIGIELMQHATEPNLVFDKDEFGNTQPFTPAQYASLRELIRGLLQRYPAILYTQHPAAAILYHNAIQPEADPVDKRWKAKYDPIGFDANQIQNLSACPDSVSSVTVLPVSFGIMVGDTVTLHATASWDAANLPIEWEQPSPFASIDSRGLLVGLAAGYRPIRVSIGGVMNNQGGAGVSVYSVLDSVSFRPPVSDPASDGTCYALATYSSFAITDALRWTSQSSDPTIATFSQVVGLPEQHCLSRRRSGVITLTGSFGGRSVSRTVIIP